MATHDYSLANQSGASFRSDLNNCLSAVLSNNSNATAPSTTVAYMLWADTSNAVLKIRNSANNAWVELFQLDGTLTMEDGAEATPGLAFRDDLNTGIWSSAADTFNISTAGTERLELGAATVFNEGGNDVDFRIEGDGNANLFYLDAGTEQIGIRTTPDGILTIDSSALDAFGDPDDPSDYAMVIRKSDTTDAGNGICFTNEDGSSVGGAILHQDKGSYGVGDLTFWTSSSNNNPTEKIRINQHGNVGIGTTAITAYSGQTNVFLGGTGNFMAETAAGAGDSVHINQNAFVDSDGSWEYLVTDEAANIYLNAGDIGFRSTGSGTAGNNITWTTPFIIKASGYVGIGDSTPDSILDVEKTSSTAYPFGTAQTGTYAYSPYDHEINIKNDQKGTTDSFTGIYFHAGEHATDGKSSSARISVLRTADYQAAIVFATRNTSFEERLRIAHDKVMTSLDFKPADDDDLDIGASGARFDDIYATNGTIQTSDKNEKNTIVNSDLGLSFVNKLKPVSYKFNGKTRTHYGLIAQDIETTLSDISKSNTDFAGFIKEDIPDSYYTNSDALPDGKNIGDLKKAAYTAYGLRYHEFIGPLVKAVQELSTEVNTLKTKVAALEGS